MKRLDVSICLIEQNGAYILQRRKAEPTKGASGLIGAFGGKIEFGESPVEAICRELSEETSLRPSTENFDFIGHVDVISDRDLKRVQIIANVFKITIPDAVTIVAIEGELVRMVHNEALENRSELTPATRAVFEQLI